MTYAGAPQYFSIAWTTSSRVAVLLFKPKTAKSEILCQLSERGPMLMLFTRQSASSSSCAVGLNSVASIHSPFPLVKVTAQNSFSPVGGILVLTEPLL